MPLLALIVLLLWVAAIVLCLVQAFGYALGKVAPGWLGLGFAGLAYLLGNHLS